VSDIDDRLIEALKYDERIWRAFETLKTCHREGLLEALASACEVGKLRADLSAWKSAAVHVDNFRSEARGLREQLIAMEVERDAYRSLACDLLPAVTGIGYEELKGRARSILKYGPTLPEAIRREGGIEP